MVDLFQFMPEGQVSNSMERTSSIQADINAVLATLEKLGQPSLKEMLIRNHGVQEPCWGVKLGDMKPIVRKLKHRQDLAWALYDTGHYDAMILAGMIADPMAFKRQDLTRWLERARGGSLAGHTIPRLVALGPHAWVLGPRWIELKNTRKRAAGWVVLGMLALSRPDDTLDMQRLSCWMQRVGASIHDECHEVQYAMNGFLIQVGCGVESLHQKAKEMAARVGRLNLDLGNNACQCPEALAYLERSAQKGVIGKKRTL